MDVPNELLVVTVTIDRMTRGECTGTLIGAWSTSEHATTTGLADVLDVVRSSLGRQWAPASMQQIVASYALRADRDVPWEQISLF